MIPADEPDADEEDEPLVEVVTGAVTGLTLLVAFGLMFAGFSFFWVVFVVGFAGVLPTAISIARYYQRQRDSGRKPGRTATRTDETADALEELRNRYARGELSDEEFDRRVERLVETESVRDAEKYAQRLDTRERQQTHEHEHELERE